MCTGNFIKIKLSVEHSGNHKFCLQERDSYSARPKAFEQMKYVPQVAHDRDTYASSYNRYVLITGVPITVMFL